ncbi:MAG TPA: LLM class flavin-dependent oxidoreductase [Actinomycetota bacterium]|nr:LLM class flavin-dependent oxidoreductase [Actinomycetota bacterium]
MEPTGPVRGVGFALRDPLPWRDVVEVVETAEDAGYGALFLPETRGREPFATLAALSAVTEALLLGTGVVPMGARSPVTTAMAGATVHEVSGGRLVLGIGTGDAGPGALGRLRAYVGTVRRLLAGERAEVDGRPERLWLALPSPPPIWISALGPRAMRLAGEIADGVLLNWCPPERVAFARERIREGAEAAGRDPASVTVAVYVRACVGPDEDAALAALRAQAGTYASYPAYRRQFHQVGLGELADRAAAAHGAGRPEEVPEALVRAVCVLGDVAAAAERFTAYRDAGADLPVVYPVPCLDPRSSVVGTLLALAPRPGGGDPPPGGGPRSGGHPQARGDPGPGGRPRPG